MSQAARDRAMSGLHSRRHDILVATDIAARGIDVTGASRVISFDVPDTP
jgi:ATP-dependent RNA helicase RhlE